MSLLKTGAGADGSGGGAWIGAGLPHLVAAEVSPGGDALVLTFDRTVTASMNAADGLVLHATGGDLSGTASDISPGDDQTGNPLVFNALSRAIGHGEVLTLDYDSGPGTIRSSPAGVNLASFAGFAVANNVP